MSRARHPRKELEALCQAIEAEGWRIERKTGYFKAYCPCRQHKTTIHLSPSDANYRQNKAQWIRRQPCWTKGLP